MASYWLLSLFILRLGESGYVLFFPLHPNFGESGYVLVVVAFMPDSESQPTYWFVCFFMPDSESRLRIGLFVSFMP